MSALRSTNVITISLYIKMLNFKLAMHEKHTKQKRKNEN